MEEPLPKKARRLFDPFTLVCGDGKSEIHLEIVDIVRSCQRVEQYIDDFPGSTPDRITVPAEHSAEAVGCFVRLIEDVQTAGKIRAGTLTSELYVEVFLIADFLQAKPELISKLRGFKGASEAMLQQRATVMSRAPEMWGATLASRMYTRAQPVDRLEILKWFMRGSKVFCHNIAARISTTVSVTHLQTVTEHLFLAGKEAMAKIRPHQLTACPYAGCLAWQRLLVHLGIEDQGAVFPNLHKAKFATVFVDLKAKPGTVVEFLLQHASVAVRALFNPGDAFDGIRFFAQIGLLGAYLASILKSAAPLLKKDLQPRGQAQDAEDEESRGVQWGVMSVISFLPLFDWLAWVFAAQEDPERGQEYYTFAFLYALPILTNGLQQDAFTIAAVLACAAHVQVERIVQTEPELITKGGFAKYFPSQQQPTVCPNASRA
ncbi:hypothetical protein WJX73_005632 [Symbiochloris irregularis]|uniref:Uncharacterized protein n=1 Tax=Symbiochloris irregularis TaxID=706552 RepID=A0AAW1NT40_9CHLO